MTRRLCGEGKWPYFVDTDYAVSVDDVIESALAFDACDLTLLAISCDQGIVVKIWPRGYSNIFFFTYETYEIILILTFCDLELFLLGISEV